MNYRRTPVVAATVALALAGLAVAAAPAAASEKTTIRSQIDVVLVTARPDGVAQDATPPQWKDEAVVTAELQTVAAWYSAQTGVDFQFVDPTFRHLYVDASLCASTWATIDWDAIYAAFGTTEADYTTRDTGANRHLFAVFHPSCYTGAQSFTKAEPGTLDTGGRVVINDRDIEAWPDFNFYLLVHELGHTFGLDHSNSTTCSSASNIWSEATWHSCADVEYGDDADFMGLGTALSPLRRYELNLLPEDDWELVDGTATSTISLIPPAVAADGSNLTNQLILIAETDSTALALELPDWSKKDTTIAIRRLDADHTTHLIGPIGPGGVPQRLGVGQTFRNKAGTITVTLQSAAKTGATVKITRTGSSIEFIKVQTAMLQFMQNLVKTLLAILSHTAA